jgi:hypothetical protein
MSLHDYIIDHRDVDCLTGSTFDLGVFAVDERWLGALVVQDED